MIDVQSRMLELASQGFECSQILAIMALEMDGMENQDLIRAMSGLVGGMGRTGHACGALTGGCCVLGMFTGKGDPEELEHSRAREIISKYVKWFEDELVPKYGGIDCQHIVGGDYSRCLVICQPIVTESFYKIMELLQEYEII